MLAVYFPDLKDESEIDSINTVWERLDPWPDAVNGLQRIREFAIIAPLSNGNFSDMVRLSRHASLP